jgi:hypothetical protein
MLIPELGSGAVKITPGHDFNDFEVGKRAGFKAGDMLNMLDAEAKRGADGGFRIPDDISAWTGSTRARKLWRPSKRQACWNASRIARSRRLMATAPARSSNRG